MSGFLRIATAGALLFASQAASQAATLKSTNIGNWLAGAYSDDDTGKFSHCAGLAQYRNGLSLLFGIDKAYQWSFGLGNDNWNLAKGSRYPISIRIDGSGTLQETAVAIDNKLVEINLADSSRLFDAFKYGRLLTVYTAGKTFQFRLTETSVLLPALLGCVRSYVSPPAESASNPFGGDTRKVDDTRKADEAPKQEVAAPGVDANAALVRRAEATSFVANVLGRSGVTGFQIVAPDGQKDTSDAAWRAGDTYGFVNIIDDPASRPEDLNAALLASDAKSCQDKFLSGSMPDKDGPRLFTSCKSNNSTITVYYSVVKRPKGGFYVLSTGGVERTALGEGKPARDADTGIRSAAYQVVSTTR